ncbi:MAG: hypothetical protein MI861_09495, partial [Pirellulales bacterium]|nr:hypothetical protein [Pirellulales bacterium]
MNRAPEPPDSGSLSFGLERIGLLPLRFPVVSAVVIAVMTAIAVYGISLLKVDDSLSELFRTNTPAFNDYKRMADRFPTSEFDVLVVVEGENLLEREPFDKLRNVVLELQFVPAMQGLISLFSARQPPAPDGGVPPPAVPAE